MRLVRMPTRVLAVLVGAWIVQASLVAQVRTGPVSEALLAYPELVVHNGRIVTMDDRSPGERVGTVAQAMAVRKGQILLVGDNQAVLALAGPATRRIDLQGRTVIPGLIEPHAHAHDYAVGHWGLAGIPPPIVIRGEDVEEVQRTIRQQVGAKVRELPAGQWIRLSLLSKKGRDFIRTGPLQKKFLDDVAPSHPVLMTVGTMALVNSKAMTAVQDFFGGPLVDDALDHDTGVAEFGTEFSRSIPVDILMQGKTEYLVDMVRKELEEWAAYGVTTYSSHINTPHHMNVFGELVRRNQMPIRFAWTHRSGTLFNAEASGFYRRLGDLSGIGTDFFWNIGSTVGHLDQTYPGVCTTIDARPAVKAREICLGDKGDFKRQVMYDMVRAGQRITGTHIAGDRAMDFFLDIVEEASRDAGYTKEEIRAKRHVIDHCTMSPRPEQYARLKDLGITMSCANKYLEGARDIVADYGERYLSWVAPVRSLIDAGIPTVWEMDTHDAAENGVFHYLQVFVTREVGGGTWAPEQRVNRTTALKMATSWASSYVLRERDLGTLEAGKKGDFIVLNRDYWEVPEKEIHTVRPLMTIVDGHVRFLDAAWAKELAVAPVGYQPEMDSTGKQP